MRWRNRLVLLALGVLEVGIVVAIVVYLTNRPDRPKPLATASTPTEVPDDPLPAAIAAGAATPGTVTAPAVTAAAVASVAAGDPADAESAADAPGPVLPDHVAELDAFFTKPPGSETWSPEQRKAYIRSAFDALDTKDRALEREVDLDRRRGDTEGVARAQATLDHLRSRRREIDAQFGPLLDAGG